MKLVVYIDPDSMKELKKTITEIVENAIFDSLRKHQYPESSTTDDKLLTRNQVMKMLNISHSTLYHYQMSSTLTFIKIGKRVYFKEKEILEKFQPYLK